ncbi:MAG: helix-hairpin-helix domain-containing protein, partial [Myxococcales bacterium]|nr:helix-hairpin-helix domain-containing protein [Myxococcales bacterium]
LVVAAVGLAVLWQHAGPLPASPVVEPCTRVGVVDGQLRCDDELPPEPAALCLGTGPRAAEPIGSGDVLDTAQLCAHPSAAPGDPGWARMAPDALAVFEVPVDVNRASADELTSLPRVGPVLARRIVEGRPYGDLDALLRVRGIGPATLERLRSRVTVGSPRL